MPCAMACNHDGYNAVLRETNYRNSLRFMRLSHMESICARHCPLTRVQLSKLEAIAEDNKDQAAKLEETIKASK